MGYTPEELFERSGVDCIGSVTTEQDLVDDDESDEPEPSSSPSGVPIRSVKKVASSTKKGAKQTQQTISDVQRTTSQVKDVAKAAMYVKKLMRFKSAVRGMSPDERELLRQGLKQRKAANMGSFWGSSKKADAAERAKEISSSQYSSKATQDPSEESYSDSSPKAKAEEARLDAMMLAARKQRAATLLAQTEKSKKVAKFKSAVSGMSPEERKLVMLGLEQRQRDLAGAWWNPRSWGKDKIKKAVTSKNLRKQITVRNILQPQNILLDRIPGPMQPFRNILQPQNMLIKAAMRGRLGEEEIALAREGGTSERGALKRRLGIGSFVGAGLDQDTYRVLVWKQALKLSNGKRPGTKQMFEAKKMIDAALGKKSVSIFIPGGKPGRVTR